MISQKLKNILSRKWGPEYFTFRIYKLFTYIRVPIFWLLLVLWVSDLLYFDLEVNLQLPFWDSEIFNSMAIKMIYLLLSVGAFTAAFITIGIELIKTKREAKTVTAIWSNLVKYAIYPFVVATFIGVILFLKKVGVYDTTSFSLFLLFAYLTINSVYTTIRAGENLVNEAFQDNPAAKP